MIRWVSDEKERRRMEESMTQRGWLITHKNCLDGATAAIVGEQCGLTPIFIEPDRVLDGFALITHDAPIYLADVSLKPEHYQGVSSRIAKLLDHHQSALPLSRYPNVLIDLSKSGSHLFYAFAVDQGWLKPTPEWERLVYAVERYDLWKPAHEPGQNLNRLFHTLGYDWYRERFAVGWNPYQSHEQALLADLIFREKQYMREQLKRSVKVWSPLPMIAIALSEEGATNELAHQLLGQGAALVVFIKPDGRLSARSDVRIDAAKLMEDVFSGGGHARAAGGRLDLPGPYDQETARAVLERIANYLRLKSRTLSK